MKEILRAERAERRSRKEETLPQATLGSSHFFRVFPHRGGSGGSSVPVDIREILNGYLLLLVKIPEKVILVELKLLQEFRLWRKFGHCLVCYKVLFPDILTAHNLLLSRLTRTFWRKRLLS